MIFEDVVPLRTHAAQQSPWVFREALKRFGRSRFARIGGRPARHAVENVYILVLLAEQEIAAGRNEQAQTLIDAAYEAFDRKFAGQ